MHAKQSTNTSSTTSNRQASNGVLSNQPQNNGQAAQAVLVRSPDMVARLVASAEHLYEFADAALLHFQQLALQTRIERALFRAQMNYVPTSVSPFMHTHPTLTQPPFAHAVSPLIVGNPGANNVSVIRQYQHSSGSYNLIAPQPRHVPSLAQLRLHMQAPQSSAGNNYAEALASSSAPAVAAAPPTSSTTTLSSTSTVLSRMRIKGSRRAYLPVLTNGPSVAVATSEQAASACFRRPYLLHRRRKLIDEVEKQAVEANIKRKLEQEESARTLSSTKLALDRRNRHADELSSSTSTQSDDANHATRPTR